MQRKGVREECENFREIMKRKGVREECENFREIMKRKGINMSKRASRKIRFCECVCW